MSTNYDLKSLNLPRLAGTGLRAFTSLLESPARKLILPKLLKDAGIAWFRELEIDAPPTNQPIHFSGTYSADAPTIPQEKWPKASAQSPSGFKFMSAHDYAEAYRSGDLTPESVAEKVLQSIEASDQIDPPLRAFIAVNEDNVLQQAKAATERIQSGNALSIFDGVPVAVKDELDMLPYPTTVGTAFLGTKPYTEDATVVAKMRAAGALLIGKTNMHEIGIGVTGLNPVHGTPRNPYALGHYTGGSSSGSGAAVAAGFCPVAIGADGGGSIRIPAAFCGVVGLKPTYGRLSEFGAAPLCWSVAHLGPLAATATDAALAYAVMAGPDKKDPVSLHQPAPELEGWDRANLSDLTIGIYREWFRHAQEEIVSACEKMLGEFESAGAKIKEIEIPNLEAARVAHAVTIASEMAQAVDRHYKNHYREHGLDVRLNFALARSLTSMDYIQAQRARTQLMADFNDVLQQVDVIVTPPTGITAPPIPKDAIPDGESDLSLMTEIMRFATPGNLTGLPGISFPVGYNSSGLPIGMQAMGRAWDEKTLLRLALVAEQLVERQAPQVYYK